MRTISIKKPGIEAMESHELKGKKVLTYEGKEMGKISDILIDKDLEVEGVLIHRGIIKKDIFVGKNYIQSIGKEGAILKITPPTEYEGMKVFDSTGKEIGTVKKVNTTPSNTVNIVIDRGLMKENLVVTNDSVQNIGENVILNIELEK